ncbi:MAG: glycosyltransferase family 4 protein [Victivallaceae bacterium]|nr:glycosyltransferase family 4 protein [Victivallaceae bacterium]
MVIVYFFTKLGLTGGPLVHYNMMNGLINLEHQVFVVTQNVFFKWHHDAYLEHIIIHNKPNVTHENAWLITTKFCIKIINKLDRLLCLNLNPSPPKNVMLTVSEITDRLIENFENLGVKPDVLVATHIYTADAVYKLNQKSKMLIHHLHFEELMFDNIYDRAVIRAILSLFDNHIVNSLWLKKMFKYFYDIEAKTITPAGNKGVFGTDETFSKFDYLETINVITYCDTQRSFKGYKQLTQILNLLQMKLPNIKIKIFGMPPCGNCINFNYEYLGWLTQDELAKYYKKSHILILSSWYESFPFPPIEAMLSCCIVACCKYGTEDYIKDQETGIIINPMNPVNSVNKIIQILNDHNKMKSMSHSAKRKAMSYDWKEKVKEFDIYLKQIDNVSVNYIDIEMLQHGDFSQIEKIYS